MSVEATKETSILEESLYPLSDFPITDHPNLVLTATKSLSVPDACPAWSGTAVSLEPISSLLVDDWGHKIGKCFPLQITHFTNALHFPEKWPRLKQVKQTPFFFIAARLSSRVESIIAEQSWEEWFSLPQNTQPAGQYPTFLSVDTKAAALGML
ncbi:hypothetical protein JTE90_022373 [Oedothorax gibbosus]|uniref:Uncharacterized protein n=1 Tax=Oedothorax gibbosus TaxID=931172 RepID=A0AAV6UMI0_9ARAC|nr:hypothetical protein JTE90_022373 [Oedothorax gibbosus]